MAGFVGRSRELALLAKRLERVTSAGSGVALAIRGRRQVGKSRLVQEFCDRSGAPYVFYAATRGASPVEAITAFHAELRDSGLPSDPELVPAAGSGEGWADAFRVLAAALPDRPSIVVLDELPWLAEQDNVFDGALQTAWDRLLAQRPVLLLLLGSDLHMMERLTAYDRPFFGRADNLALGPLNPAETGSAAGLSGADAIDAQLVTGGLPGILRAWPSGTPALEFLRQEVEDPSSPVFGVPEAALLAEFPRPDHARRVLEAVGSGDRTHATIAAAAGAQAALPSGSLSPLLRQLTDDKRVLAVDQPLSTHPGKPALYRVADSNLRLYLAILRQAHEQVRRGRSDAAYRLIERRWTSWRGRAVEPLIREALEIAGAARTLPFPDVEAVGGWWNRQFSPEVDLIGADRSPVARTLFFAGSVKWLGTPFEQRDLDELVGAAALVPGFVPGSTGLVAVSLSGFTAETGQLDLRWGPGHVVGAWQ
jgi:AAA+ ATPase superfamily predicted ATPase